MYVPDQFRADNVDQCHALMRAKPFAILVGHGGGQGLVATHLPTILVSDPAPFGVIEAHFARPNPHWRMYEADGAEAMLIFSGPQSYIHPGWYPSKADTGKVVPTWNYATVHAYGRVEIVNDVDWLRQHVSELTDQQEAAREQPWALDDAPEDYIQVMLRGIIGLRFVISRLEGKRKMSQNRPDPDRLGVMEGLRHSDSDNANQVADLIEEERDK